VPDPAVHERDVLPRMQSNEHTPFGRDHGTIRVLRLEGAKRSRAPAHAILGTDSSLLVRLRLKPAMRLVGQCRSSTWWPGAPGTQCGREGTPLEDVSWLVVPGLKTDRFESRWGLLLRSAARDDRVDVKELDKLDGRLRDALSRLPSGVLEDLLRYLRKPDPTRGELIRRLHSTRWNQALEDLQIDLEAAGGDIRQLVRFETEFLLRRAEGSRNDHR
jgi:hypothetical protein